MSEPKFGFFFEKAGLSRPQGATSSDEEHFKGTSVAEALVRELGQNSLDAADPDGNGVVKLEFELREVPVKDIPDFENLRKHILAADETTKEIDKNNSRLKDAAEAIQNESLMVLRVGDYGTLGLGGSEKQSDLNSPLVALTRGAGISADKDGGGGSFGVGSSVGTLASAVHTVFWTSLPKGKAEVVFAGFSQLATHKLDDGEYLGPDGFFTDKNHREDFSYLRSPAPFGPFAGRSEVGTDVYVLGYKDESDYSNLVKIRNELIRNFMVAIHRGKLEVVGKTDEGQWVLNKDTIENYVNEVADAKPFYMALMDKTPFVKNIDGLGEVKLYIEVNDSFEKKFNTITIRKPLMRIAEYKHTSISMKYAAIMECSNDEGNQVLRALESPRHDKWEPTRAKNGPKVIKQIKAFILEGLKSRMKTEIGDEIKIAGLEKFLPASINDENLSGFKEQALGKPKNGSPKKKESASFQGEEAEETPEVKDRGKAVPLKITKRGEEGEGTAGNKKKDTGSDKKRENPGSKLPAEGKEGDGNAEIPVEEIRSRIWADPSTDEIVVKLGADKPTFGSITLCVLGRGGETDESYKLPIKKVSMKTTDKSTELKFEGNRIIGVDIAGKPASAELRIKLSEKRRYSLAVI
ncbi:hypothetical protein [Corynebacterium callunae]|uniref:hypothetical protein n=1 Tax=Corynebacterium callunae TaxID=1721 RepID=UPI001FFE3524|nr:hypothetical protein [Corynebacterium callunae]MCK2200695.1 hypothetical protein [Corynebacterium callunae]